jgi:hypothetical protein
MQHLRGKNDGDRLLGTVLPAGPAMPAFIRILDDGVLIPLLKDDVSRTMSVASSAFFAFFVIDDGRQFNPPQPGYSSF